MKVYLICQALVSNCGININIILFLYWEKCSLHKYIIFYADRCIWGRKLWHGSIWQFFPMSVVHMIRSLLAVQETWVRSLGWEDPLEECMAIHSSVLSWRIPWTEKPGELQSTGLQRVGHELSSKQQWTKKGRGENRNEVAPTGDVQVRMNVSRGLNQRQWVLWELGTIEIESLRIPIWHQSKKKKKFLTHLWIHLASSFKQSHLYMRQAVLLNVFIMC